jgi:hypothetical protein
MYTFLTHALNSAEIPSLLLTYALAADAFRDALPPLGSSMLAGGLC